MKAMIKKLGVIALIAAAGFFFGSCEDVIDNFTPVSQITVSPSTLNLTLGGGKRSLRVCCPITQATQDSHGHPAILT